MSLLQIRDAIRAIRVNTTPTQGYGLLTGLAASCILALSLTHISPAHAFECVNDSISAQGADDGGDTSNTACGPSATVTGTSSTGSTAIGATAKANFLGTALGNLAQAGSSATAIGQLAGANLNSIAIGKEAVAGDTSKDSSAALGMEAVANGGGSIALGRRSSASADHSIAIGAAVPSLGIPSAEASETQSIAVGTGAKANGFSSIAIGGDSVDGDNLGAQATHNRGIAIGPDAIAAANFGSAWGWDANAAGDYSTALGSNSTAGENDTTVLGANAAALSPHNNATAIGARAKAEQSNSMILGSVPGVNDPPLATNPYVDVGIGVTAPMAALHVKRTDHTLPAQILVEDTSATTEPRSMFELINNGPVGFNMTDTNTGNNWRFAAQTTGFRVSLAGTGGPEFEVLNNGDAVLAGTLTENSDINVKQDIEELDGAMVLAKLDEVPVSQWAYKASPESQHIGPMAQDFHAAFGLGADERHISPRDMAGVNMAAIKALTEALADKDAEIAQLRGIIEDMQMRLQKIEAARPTTQAALH